MLRGLLIAVSTFSFAQSVSAQSSKDSDYEVKQVKGSAYTFRYEER
jgi:hypothetical protein